MARQVTDSPANHPHPTMKIDPVRIVSRALLVGAWLLSLTPRSSAQTAPEKKPAEPDTVVKLEDFTVSTSVGTYEETTTSTAGKVPLEFKDLASTVQVLNASFIGDKLATTLEDLYPFVVGMTRESPAGAGFTLRGYSNSQTNTMINNLTTDGLPGGASRFGSPTVANVERVEVMKGPNSVLYGAMNPGGLINVVTKQPSAKAGNVLFASVSSYAGNQGKNGTGYNASLDSTGPIDAQKHWLYRFIASYEDAATWRQFDFSKNYYFFPSLTYRLNENTEATLKVELHRESRLGINDQSLVAPNNLAANVPTDHSIVYQDPGNTHYDRGNVYNLSMSHHFGNQWTTKFNFRDVQHVDGRRLLENRSINVAPVLANSTITQRLRDTWNRRRYAYYDWNIYGDVGPDTFKHTLLLGVNGGYETHNFTRWLFQNVTGAPISVYAPVHGLTTYPTVNGTTGTGPTQVAVSKYYNYAAYFSDQIKIGKEWRVSLGVHSEKYDTKYTDTAVLLSTGKFVNPGQANNPSSTVPSIGVVYEPTDMLSLYASYAKSFKPTPPQGVAIGAPEPGPETADQKEVGVKVDFMHRQLGVTLSVYEINRNGVVEAVPTVFDPVTGIQVYRSLSNKSQGFELSVNYQPVQNWQTQIGYSSNDAKVTNSAQATLVNAQLANAPRSSGNIWTRYNIPDGALRGFGLGLGIVYTGQRNVNVDNRPDQALTLPSITRADLSLYYKWKRCDYAINISNVTDKSYLASGDAATDIVPGAPRKVTMSVRYPF